MRTARPSMAPSHDPPSRRQCDDAHIRKQGVLEIRNRIAPRVLCIRFASGPLARTCAPAHARTHMRARTCAPAGTYQCTHLCTHAHARRHAQIPLPRRSDGCRGGPVANSAPMPTCHRPRPPGGPVANSAPMPASRLGKGSSAGILWLVLLLIQTNCKQLCCVC